MSALVINQSRQDVLLSEIIDLIQQGEVIPVLGHDLLKLTQEGSHTEEIGLYERLVIKCREKWNADDQGLVSTNTSFADLSRCLVSHPDYGSEPIRAYQELAHIYREIRRNALLPFALLKLAQIRSLNVFISTTVDDFLESALNEVRFGGKPRTKVLPFWLKKAPTNEELAVAFESGLPVVVKLFGSIDRPLNRFAVSESDYIEATYRLHAFERSPGRLFDRISEKHILILGNAFPDWLARFFLRLTRANPLWFTDGRTKQYLVASMFESDPLLQFFLRKCTKMTELVSGHDLDGFLAKLAEHLGDMRTDEEREQNQPFSPESDPFRQGVGGVFISYSSRQEDGSPSVDAAAAFRLAATLDEHGIATWLDRSGGLHPGDQFRSQIKRSIEHCSIFLPLISTHTELRLDGFFRREWAWAVERSQDFTGTDRPFIIPIIIDDIQPSAIKHVPEQFLEKVIATAPGGVPNLEVIHRIRDCVRSIRRLDRRQ